MLISADLIPLKKLAQDHPTAWVIDPCQQLQLTSFVYLVNCRLSTAGTLKSTAIATEPLELAGSSSRICSLFLQYGPC